MNRQITKDSNEILGDGAFDASEAATHTATDVVSGRNEAVAAWLKAAPEELRNSPAFAAVAEAAKGAYTI